MLEFVTNYGSLIFGLGLGMVAGNFFRPWAKRIGLLSCSCTRPTGPSFGPGWDSFSYY